MREAAGDVIFLVSDGSVIRFWTFTLSWLEEGNNLQLLYRQCCSRYFNLFPDFLHSYHIADVQPFAKDCENFRDCGDGR